MPLALSLRINVIPSYVARTRTLDGVPDSQDTDYRLPSFPVGCRVLYLWEATTLYLSFQPISDSLYLASGASCSHVLAARGLALAFSGVCCEISSFSLVRYFSLCLSLLDRTLSVSRWRDAFRLCLTVLERRGWLPHPRIRSLTVPLPVFARFPEEFVGFLFFISLPGPYLPSLISQLFVAARRLSSRRSQRYFTSNRLNHLTLRVLYSLWLI